MDKNNRKLLDREEVTNKIIFVSLNHTYPIPNGQARLTK